MFLTSCLFSLAQVCVGILRQRSTDLDVKKYCVSLLHKFGSFKYTRDTLFELEARYSRTLHKLSNYEVNVLCLKWQTTSDNESSNRHTLKMLLVD